MDKVYWRNFYQNCKISKEPSLFAKFVYKNYLLKDNEYLESKNCSDISLLELGCGNGRDSLYFASNGISVTAIDQVNEEIAFLNASYAESIDSKDIKLPSSPPPIFLAGDFTDLKSFDLTQLYSCIYSRFTLHSINIIQQGKVFLDSLIYCKKDGIFAIEARGEKNTLFGKGDRVENNAFIYDNHYRRFLNFNQTLIELETLRFMGGGCRIVLEFFMQVKKEAFLHLMARMIILFVLSLRRIFARLIICFLCVSKVFARKAR